MQILEPTGENRDLSGNYPWDVWLENDGKPRVLHQPLDFPTGDTKNMQVYIYQQSKLRGLKAVTRIVDGQYLVYQVYRYGEEDPPKLPNFRPSAEKPRCRHCNKVLTRYAVPFGECRVTGRPNQRSCK